MSEHISEDLQKKLDDLPTSPGVYLYKNSKGKVIYVGKAKVLRNRVRSYFQSSRNLDPKTRNLVEEICDLDLISTENELEAMILENSLIKTEKPKYNIRLVDDKDWLYIQLTVDEEFPRVRLIRRPDKSAGLVFGPYIPSSLARKTKALLHKYFGVRTCNREITGEDPRACLQYDMHRCSGPCIDKDAFSIYKSEVSRARLLLEGKNNELLTELKQAMFEASSQTLYEKAAGLRDAIDVVKRQAEEQRIASTGFEEQDIFAFHVEDNKGTLIMFAVRNGLVKSKKEYHWQEVNQNEARELLSTAIQQYYHGISYIPKTIIVPHEPENKELLEQWLSTTRGTKVEIAIPMRGKKKNLLQLAQDNARLSWKNRFTITEKEALQALQDELQLNALPRHIECFDISNIQGSDTVASMVCWMEGKPRKSEYRKYKIKTVEGSDDFASMHEVVTRRYSRLVREEKPLPDLVLIDGGKGQLSSSFDALKKEGVEHIPLVSIAKKEELLFSASFPDGLALEHSNPGLRLLQRIRDEAHRFAITFHRSRREQRTLTTELKRIPGIGPKLSRKLLQSFGSLTRVKQAEEDKISEIIGPSKARLIREYFESQNEQDTSEATNQV
jgi:excinuclease ABC subunit C